MKKLLYYAACAQKKIVPERPVSRRLMSALVSSHVMAMRKSNWWRLWPAMAAVKSLWAIAAA